jgi:hypothetical protein
VTKPNERVYYPFIIKRYICMAVPSHKHGCRACVVIGCNTFECRSFGAVRQSCGILREGISIVFKVVRKVKK